MPEPTIGSGYEGELPASTRRAFFDLRRLIKGLTDRTADLETLTTPSAWTAASFSNSWVNYGSGEQEVQYRKVGDSVELRGACKDGTVNATVFTLPAGFRPPAGLGFPITGFEGGAYALTNALISSAGVVAHRGNTNDYVTFDGISFSVTT